MKHTSIRGQISRFFYFVAAATFFGLWQNSSFAGFFCYFALLSLTSITWKLF